MSRRRSQKSLYEMAKTINLYTYYTGVSTKIGYSVNMKLLLILIYNINHTCATIPLRIKIYSISL